jgi:predicted nucleic acid-binding protein
MSEKDIFYLDTILPEPDKIFGFEYKSVNEIVDNCIFVFDTNVLFVPFDASKKNLSEIRRILLKLKKEGRLYLPARAAREFGNNRAKRLGDLFLKIRQAKENLNTGHFKIEDYPLLQDNTSYKKVINNYEKIVDLINSSRKLLDSIESDILRWNWNDNVSKLYKEIFTTEIIKEVQKSKEGLIEDLKFRIEHKIAPGYKDSGKLDDGIGDLIIWQTAQEIARDENKDLILVSNDQKNDWFYKQDKKGLYPKYELFDEFRRTTNGKSIQIIDFPKFLEVLDAAPETITEMKESIEKTIDSNRFSKHYSENDLLEGMMIEHRKFGCGEIRSIYKNSRGNSWIEVDFKDFGVKKLLLKFTPMRILNNAHNFLLMNPDFDGDPKTYQLLDIDEE